MTPLSLALTVLALAVLIATLTSNIIVAVIALAFGAGTALVIAGVALMSGGLSSLCKVPVKRS